jgi:hypothetical protein
MVQTHSGQFRPVAGDTRREFMTELNRVTTASLATLEAAAKNSHEEYSRAFHAREDREQELTVIAKQRAAILRALDAAKRALPKLTQEALDSCMANPGGADPTSLIAARHRIELLKQTLAHFSSYAYADHERALLIARISEGNLQLQLEETHVALQESKTFAAVASVEAQSGSLELTSAGGRVEAMRVNVAQIADRCATLRRELRDHDAATNEARAIYEKEFLHV